MSYVDFIMYPFHRMLVITVKYLAMFKCITSFTFINGNK